jgi:GNAT superfamily N-acetyltransferase
MAAPDGPSFSLRPVVEGDIPELTAISSLTFDTDRHTQLKAAHPTKPYDHAAGTPDSIRHWLSLPQKVEVTKAVDNATGQIVGCVGWVFRGFDRDPGAVDTAQTPPEPINPPDDSVSSDHIGTGSADLDPLEQLRELTDDHFARFMRRTMPPGTRCMFIAGIQVHPEHQGKGIGRALVRQGTERADAEGVICWVHSSEAGAGLFPKCGFEVSETLEIDLDEWAGKMNIEPPPGDERWGTYTFRYFIRQPCAS